jgi:hypothetical protein
MHQTFILQYKYLLDIMDPIVALALLLFVVLGIVLVMSSRREGYIDPIYINHEKLRDDWYPRANGTIYGCNSTIFSGYPYYPKAY